MFFYPLLFACIYVASLYVFVPFEVRKLPRDNLYHMKYRVAAASIATLTALLLFAFLIPYYEILNLSYLEVLGFYHIHVHFVSIRAVILMVIFYLGPLVASLIIRWTERTYKINPLTGETSLLPPSEHRSLLTTIYDHLKEDLESEPLLVLFRNLIFAPITEEVVFRAVIVATLFIDYKSKKILVSETYLALVSTIFFGVAHLHHLYEKIRSGEDLVRAIISTLVQFTYTSIFGFIAAILFIRTGSIFPPIISHIICNFIGLPNLGFLSPPRSNGSNYYSPLYSYRWILLFLHALGLIIFAKILFPFTSVDALFSYLHQMIVRAQREYDRQTAI